MRSRRRLARRVEPKFSPRVVAWVITAVVPVAAACSDGAGVQSVNTVAEDCGLRTATRAREGAVPAPFLPAGSELVDVRTPRIGGLSAVVNLAYSVEDAFEIYKAASKKAGFQITSVDFEGFEAEIWLRNAKELGSIVVRRSMCADASGAIISIVAKRDLAG